MRIPHKKFLAAFTGVLCAAALTVPVWAMENADAPEEVAQVMGAVETEEILLPDAAPLPDSDALFYGYLLQRAGATDEAGLLSATAYARLSEKNRELYDYLKPFIMRVADGTETSTVCKITYDDFPSTLTATELGVSNCFSDEGKAAIEARADECYHYDTGLVFDALLADFPYELYWYDKSASGGVHFRYKGASYSGSSRQVTITSFPTLTVTMYASQYYAPGDDTTYDPTQVDRSLHDGIENVVANAQAIVEKYKNESDYNKLLGYATEICNLVDYADYAAEDPDAPYGDPWQIISVFDEDPETDVVCEGYAKSFKYLCDLSAFDSSKVECYLMTGTLGGGTGAGPHMWNIVTMDNGKNYLVDVTNSDSNGGAEYLFLKGGTPSSEKYTFYDQFTFAYDADTFALWGEELLTLDTVDYKDAAPAPTSAPVQIRGCSLTLVDDIALNFYLTLDSLVTEDADAEITLTDLQTYRNTRVENAFQGTLAGVDGTVYRVTFNLPAKRMNDKIILRCSDWNNSLYNMLTPAGDVVTEYGYSVQDYLNRAAARTELQSLAEAMSAYGYYAQQHFQYQLDSAVAPSSSFNAKLAAVTAETLAPYAPVDSGAVTGLTAVGDTLTLESAITQRWIFKIEGSLSDYAFQLDGRPVTPTAYNAESYCVEIPGIVAKNLDTVRTLTVSKGGETFTHQCSALSYAYKALNAPNVTAYLRNLVRAMYLYHTEAQAYFNR